jgi:acetate kinase
MTAPILVLNCGSSSIKFALFDPGTDPLPRTPMWSGKVEGIGGAGPRIVTSDSGPQSAGLDEERPHHAALLLVQQRVQRRLHGKLPAAVAHRVVHGGSRYTAPVRIDHTVLDELRSYVALAPLHQPHALQAIEVLLREAPDVPQVACFDTAFHHTLHEVEKMLPLPHALWQRGIRRYGFHGLSYEYMATTLAERHGDAARGRTIVAHLGSGASLCAMQGLSSVGTTMGFSALDGLMMGTRCGSIDPGVLLHLMEVDGLDAKQLTQLLYHESGLLGVSGRSAGPVPLLAAERSEPQARAALALYVRRIVREVGALTAVLGGLDMLAFTAGVGEHSAVLRHRICEALGWLGLQLDAGANDRNAPTISTGNSHVRVVVEPTNEEWVAARHALALLRHP